MRLRHPPGRPAGRSTILDYGTATRVVGPTLFAALVLRDEHCTFPGCDGSPEWCDAHHVVPVEQGGATNLANLRLRCTRHHHLVHRLGWTEELRPDGSIELENPHGRRWVMPPPGPLALPLAA